MGVMGCCGREQNNKCTFIEKEISFDKNIQQSEVGTDDDKDNKMTNKLMNSLKSYGKLIPDNNFEEILKNINKYINKIEFPKEIENHKEDNCLIIQPIEFSNGEIYKGSWNRNNQRHGFGINIKPDGTIYKGLWDKDKIGKYGLFLDSKGNYYKGYLKDGKMEGEGEMEIINKSKYKGNFNNDFPNGKGELEDYEKGCKYNGDMVDGKKKVKENQNIVMEQYMKVILKMIYMMDMEY